MKKLLLLTFFLALFFGHKGSAQAPQGIASQAVIRNSNNELITNAPIGIRVSLLQGSITGEAMYVETHTVQSNAAGLITYVLGEGTTVTGQFATIDWAAGPWFQKTEVDTEGGTNYALSGTSQLLSVPYALEAKHASSLTLTDNAGNQYQIGIDETGNLTATVVASPWQCGQPITDDRDGKTYNTVLIGTQCWMAQNLNVGILINGSTDASDNGVTEKYCYNNDEAQCDVYGGLYQWNEMMQYSTTPGVQGICPQGWHVPSDAEWTTLTTYLGGESVAGGKMKETGTTHWYSPNTGATNSSGFTGLPGGYRDTDGSFYDRAVYGYWWSSSRYDSYDAWYRRLRNNYATVLRFYYVEAYGLSVRCLKN